MPTPHESTAKPSSRPRVLLVNADRRFGAALAHVLQRAGYDARWVATGREAIGQLAAFDPEHVIAELDDNEMGGLELLATLALYRSARRTVLCTRQPSMSTLDSAVRTRLGIDAVVVRPCRLEAFVQAIADQRVRAVHRNVRPASMNAPLVPGDAKKAAVA